MSARVRRASPDDWARVRALRLRALREEPLAFGARLAEEEAQPEAFWRGRLEKKNAATFVTDDWLGMCAAYLEAPELAELVGMYVAPEARGGGVGRALVDAALAWAREAGAARIELWHNVEMQDAARLYARCGFERAGEPVPGTRFPERTFQRMERAV